MVIVVIVAIVGMGIFGGWGVCFISSRSGRRISECLLNLPYMETDICPFFLPSFFRVVSVSFPCRFRTYIEIDIVRSCGRW